MTDLKYCIKQKPRETTDTGWYRVETKQKQEILKPVKTKRGEEKERKQKRERKRKTKSTMT